LVIVASFPSGLILAVQADRQVAVDLDDGVMA
jgi:hypothetical protein